MLGHFGVAPLIGLSPERVEEAQLRYGKNELASEPGECAGERNLRLLFMAGERRRQWRSSHPCRPRFSFPSRDIHSSAGTPFWKLVIKQFDDLLVKVRKRQRRLIRMHPSAPLRPRAPSLCHPTPLPPTT